MKKELENKNNEIEDKNNELKLKTTENENIQKEIGNKNNEISLLKNELESKNNIIEEQSNEIKLKNNENQNYINQNESNNNEISLLKTELENKNNEIENKNNEISLLKKQLEEIKNELNKPKTFDSKLEKNKEILSFNIEGTKPRFDQKLIKMNKEIIFELEDKRNLEDINKKLNSLIENKIKNERDWNNLVINKTNQLLLNRNEDIVSERNKKMNSLIEDKIKKTKEWNNLVINKTNKLGINKTEDKYLEINEKLNSLKSDKIKKEREWNNFVINKIKNIELNKNENINKKDLEELLDSNDGIKSLIEDKIKNEKLKERNNLVINKIRNIQFKFNKKDKFKEKEIQTEKNNYLDNIKFISNDQFEIKSIVKTNKFIELDTQSFEISINKKEKSSINYIEDKNNQINLIGETKKELENNKDQNIQITLLGKSIEELNKFISNENQLYIKGIKKPLESKETSIEQLELIQGNMISNENQLFIKGIKKPTKSKGEEGLFKDEKIKLINNLNDNQENELEENQQTLRNINKKPIINNEDNQKTENELQKLEKIRNIDNCIQLNINRIYENSSLINNVKAFTKLEPQNQEHNSIEIIKLNKEKTKEINEEGKNINKKQDREIKITTKKIYRKNIILNKFKSFSIVPENKLNIKGIEKTKAILEKESQDNIRFTIEGENKDNKLFNEIIKGYKIESINKIAIEKKEKICDIDKCIQITINKEESKKENNEQTINIENLDDIKNNKKIDINLKPEEQLNNRFTVIGTIKSKDKQGKDSNIKTDNFDIEENKDISNDYNELKPKELKTKKIDDEDNDNKLNKSYLKSISTNEEINVEGKPHKPYDREIKISTKKVYRKNITHHKFKKIFIAPENQILIKGKKKTKTILEKETQNNNLFTIEKTINKIISNIDNCIQININREYDNKNIINDNGEDNQIKENKDNFESNIEKESNKEDENKLKNIAQKSFIQLEPEEQNNNRFAIIIESKSDKEEKNKFGKMNDKLENVNSNLIFDIIKCEDFNIQSIPKEEHREEIPIININEESNKKEGTSKREIKITTKKIYKKNIILNKFKNYSIISENKFNIDGIEKNKIILEKESQENNRFTIEKTIKDKKDEDILEEKDIKESNKSNNDISSLSKEHNLIEQKNNIDSCIQINIDRIYENKNNLLDKEVNKSKKIDAEDILNEQKNKKSILEIIKNEEININKKEKDQSLIPSKKDENNIKGEDNKPYNREIKISTKKVYRKNIKNNKFKNISIISENKININGKEKNKPILEKESLDNNQFTIKNIVDTQQKIQEISKKLLTKHIIDEVINKEKGLKEQIRNIDNCIQIYIDGKNKDEIILEKINNEQIIINPIKKESLISIEKNKEFIIEKSKQIPDTFEKTTDTTDLVQKEIKIKTKRVIKKTNMIQYKFKNNLITTENEINIAGKEKSELSFEEESQENNRFSVGKLTEEDNKALQETQEIKENEDNENILKDANKNKKKLKGKTILRRNIEKESNENINDKEEENLKSEGKGKDEQKDENIINDEQILKGKKPKKEEFQIIQNITYNISPDKEIIKNKIDEIIQNNQKESIKNIQFSKGNENIFIPSTQKREIKITTKKILRKTSCQIIKFKDIKASPSSENQFEIKGKNKTYNNLEKANSNELAILKNEEYLNEDEINEKMENLQKMKEKIYKDKNIDLMKEKNKKQICNENIINILGNEKKFNNIQLQKEDEKNNNSFSINRDVKSILLNKLKQLEERTNISFEIQKIDKAHEFNISKINSLEISNDENGILKRKQNEKIQKNQENVINIKSQFTINGKKEKIEENIINTKSQFTIIGNNKNIDQNIINKICQFAINGLIKKPEQNTINRKYQFSINGSSNKHKENIINTKSHFTINGIIKQNQPIINTKSQFTINGINKKQKENIINVKSRFEINGKQIEIKEQGIQFEQRKEYISEKNIDTSDLIPKEIKIKTKRIIKKTTNILKTKEENIICSENQFNINRSQEIKILPGFNKEKLYEDIQQNKFIIKNLNKKDKEKGFQQNKKENINDILSIQNFDLNLEGTNKISSLPLNKNIEEIKNNNNWNNSLKEDVQQEQFTIEGSLEYNQEIKNILDQNNKLRSIKGMIRKDNIIVKKINLNISQNKYCLESQTQIQTKNGIITTELSKNKDKWSNSLREDIQQSKFIIKKQKVKDNIGKEKDIQTEINKNEIENNIEFNIEPLKDQPLNKTNIINNWKESVIQEKSDLFNITKEPQKREIRITTKKILKKTNNIHRKFIDNLFISQQELNIEKAQKKNNYSSYNSQIIININKSYNSKDNKELIIEKNEDLSINSSENKKKQIKIKTKKKISIVNYVYKRFCKNFITNENQLNIKGIKSKDNHVISFNKEKLEKVDNEENKFTIEKTNDLKKEQELKEKLKTETEIQLKEKMEKEINDLKEKLKQESDDKLSEKIKQEKEELENKLKKENEEVKQKLIDENEEFKNKLKQDSEEQLKQKISQEVENLQNKLKNDMEKELIEKFNKEKEEIENKLKNENNELKNKNEEIQSKLNEEKEKLKGKEIQNILRNNKILKNEEFAIEKSYKNKNENNNLYSIQHIHFSIDKLQKQEKEIKDTTDIKDKQIKITTKKILKKTKVIKNDFKNNSICSDSQLKIFNPSSLKERNQVINKIKSFSINKAINDNEKEKSKTTNMSKLEINKNENIIIKKKKKIDNNIINKVSNIQLYNDKMHKLTGNKITENILLDNDQLIDDKVQNPLEIKTDKDKRVSEEGKKQKFAKSQSETAKSASYDKNKIKNDGKEEDIKEENAKKTSSKTKIKSKKMKKGTSKKKKCKSLVINLDNKFDLKNCFDKWNDVTPKLLIKNNKKDENRNENDNNQYINIKQVSKEINTNDIKDEDDIENIKKLGNKANKDLIKKEKYLDDDKNTNFMENCSQDENKNINNFDNINKDKINILNNNQILDENNKDKEEKGKKSGIKQIIINKKITIISKKGRKTKYEEVKKKMLQKQLLIRYWKLWKKKKNIGKEQLNEEKIERDDEKNKINDDEKNLNEIKEKNKDNPNMKSKKPFTLKINKVLITKRILELPKTRIIKQKNKNDVKENIMSLRNNIIKESKSLSIGNYFVKWKNQTENKNELTVGINVIQNIMKRYIIRYLILNAKILKFKTILMKYAINKKK